MAVALLIYLHQGKLASRLNNAYLHFSFMKPLVILQGNLPALLQLLEKPS
ncbi:Uncharacterised protein [uncultured archaeon]|nr:Uncharacterised protein [uncultured archaeon]